MCPPAAVGARRSPPDDARGVHETPRADDALQIAQRSEAVQLGRPNEVA
jgi:hypothetical protein